jgi:hypothetical protein
LNRLMSTWLQLPRSARKRYQWRDVRPRHPLCHSKGAEGDAPPFIYRLSSCLPCVQRSYARIWELPRSARKREEWRAVAPGRLGEQPEGGLPPFIYRLSSRLPAPGVLTRGFGNYL